MSDLDDKKEHIWFDLDNSEFLRDLANKQDISITKVANKLIRMISKMEITEAIELKETELHSNNGAPPIRFKKKMEIRIKL